MPQPQATQQQSDKILWSGSVCEVKATGRSLAVTLSQATRVERKGTGQISCGMRRCCSQLQRTAQPAGTSNQTADFEELSDLKVERRIDLYKNREIIL